MPDIEAGYCHCGCGQRTNRVRFNIAKRGLKAGDYRKYVKGHHHQRFHEYTVLESSCWEWSGAITESTGYGQKFWKGRLISAHVYMYEKHVGPVPKGLELDHKCRYRPCVNPDHMEPVTHAENMRRGALTKLTPNQVREIRTSSLNNERLAELYGMHPSHISRVRRGLSQISVQ